MIEKCPECKGTISVLLEKPQVNDCEINGTFTNTDILVSKAITQQQKYQCLNSLCWITKITESWE